jgi:predicted peroxiredoxin
MDNREWMYTGRPSQAQVTREWMDKTQKFLDHAFKEAKGAGVTFCPCSQCKTKKKKKESHVEGSLQVWIYVKLYPVGVPW